MPGGLMQVMGYVSIAAMVITVLAVVAVAILVFVLFVRSFFAQHKDILDNPSFPNWLVVWSSLLLGWRAALFVVLIYLILSLRDQVRRRRKREATT